jgi:hypothetical protein
MQFLFALPYLIQLLCIIHIVRNRSESYWIYIILFVPYVGGIAYLLVEMLPSLGRAPSVRSIADIVVRGVNPNGRIRNYESAAELTPTFQNKKALADEYLGSGYFEKAIFIYESLRTGIHKDDAELALMYAKALYGKGDFASADEIIDALDAAGYDFKKESEILIKLKVKEHTEATEIVYGLYESAKRRFESFEIMYYFIEYLLRKSGFQQAEAEIASIEGIKRQLDKNRIVYDRKWVKQIMRLRKAIEEGMRRA